LGVFENLPTLVATVINCQLVATEVLGYRKRPPFVRAYAPTHFSKPHPRAPPPDPRLTPGPVFLDSGDVTRNSSGQELAKYLKRYQLLA